MDGWSTLMLVIMAILLLVPTAAIFLVVIIAMFVGNAMVRCWIPWCCGVFCGGVCAHFFWQTVNALLIASNSTFVCIAIDKVNNVAVPADKDNALYALAQADIVTASDLAKVEPAKADAGAATAIAAQPVDVAPTPTSPLEAPIPEPRTLSPSRERSQGRPQHVVRRGQQRDRTSNVRAMVERTLNVPAAASAAQPEP